MRFNSAFKGLITLAYSVFPKRTCYREGNKCLVTLYDCIALLYMQACIFLNFASLTSDLSIFLTLLESSLRYLLLCAILLLIIGAGVFRRFRKIAKSKLLTLSCLYVRPSVRPPSCPDGTTRLTLDGFS
jgi:hypothetical protein